MNRIGEASAAELEHGERVSLSRSNELDEQQVCNPSPWNPTADVLDLRRIFCW